MCLLGALPRQPHLFLVLEPCAISVEEMENQMVELNGRANATISQWMYLKRGDFLELRCKPGYALATNLSQSYGAVPWKCNCLSRMQG